MLIKVPWDLQNIGNILIIGVLAAAFVGYTVYAQRQGGRVKGKKNL